MTYRNRAHPLWYAYLLHRLSGLGLVLFLPFHFYVLGLALNTEALDAALAAGAVAISALVAGVFALQVI